MTRGSYSGDHHTDQTGGKQHLAGFGWGRSTQDAGIEDWGFQHPNQAIICSDNEGVPPRTMPTRKCWKKKDGTYKIGGVSIQCRNWVGYVLWDNDGSKNNNLPGIVNIGSIRSQCAKMGLAAVRIKSASQVHNVLRPMVQKAGYNLRRGAGVPLAI